MINILFICYGNICRSPMAEMIFKDLIYQNNKRYKFTCASRATSFEELGHDIYPKARSILDKNNITCEKHIAKQIAKDDYQKYDLLIVMDYQNREDTIAFFGGDPEGKVHLLMEYTNEPKEIEDPWYTGDFDTAFKEIKKGCQSLYEYLLESE